MILMTCLGWGSKQDVVKLWFVATFGNDGHLERWPTEMAADYREKHGQPLRKRYPVKRIREIALKQYPLLEKWGTDELGWADLMYIESEAMLGAMFKLMEEGVPSLSVHDSLLVPVSKRDIAKEVLKDHYRLQTGASPMLNLKCPLPAEMRDDADFGDSEDDDHRFDNEGEGVYTAQEDDDPYGVVDRERTVMNLPVRTATKHTATKLLSESLSSSRTGLQTVRQTPKAKTITVTAAREKLTAMATTTT